MKACTGYPEGNSADDTMSPTVDHVRWESKTRLGMILATCGQDLGDVGYAYPHRIAV